jgi:oligopeptide transport system substrate-binding protein
MTLDRQITGGPFLSALLTVAVALLVLSGCGDPGGDAIVATGAESATVLQRGNGGEPGTLDPHLAEESASGQIVRDLYEGLTAEAADSAIVPGVARAWELDAAGTSYTFHLREDASWSNGEPVVAADFVFALRRSLNPETAAPLAEMLWPIRNARAISEQRMPVADLGVRAIDSSTLVIELESPTPYFLALLANPIAFPVHEATLAEHGRRFARPGVKVSNGAYRLTEWMMQSHVRLDRNEHYWERDAVDIDTVYFHVTEDVNSEFNRFRAGELDFTFQVPNSQFHWSRENLGDQLKSDPYLSTYFLLLNFRSAGIDDVRVRKALSLVIDREVLAQRVVGTGERPAYAFVPDSMPGYPGVRYEWADWPMERRIEEARRLMTQAGYGAGKPFRPEFHYNTSENHRRIAVAVASMWREHLGVEASVLNMEWKALMQLRRDTAGWQVLRFGWVADYADPNAFLELLTSGHGQNTLGWSNPEYDRTLAEANLESDPVLRAQLLGEAEKLMLEDYPLIPLFFSVNKRLVRQNVRGYQANLMNRTYTRHLRIDR